MRQIFGDITVAWRGDHGQAQLEDGGAQRQKVSYPLVAAYMNRSSPPLPRIYTVVRAAFRNSSQPIDISAKTAQP